MEVGRIAPGGASAVFRETVRRAACSSAAGGWGGLHRPDAELTTAAGRIAAFGAGAKIVGSYSRRIQPEDAAGLSALRPTLPLSGGTEGGDKQGILSNARLLAGWTVEISSSPEQVCLQRAGGHLRRQRQNVLYPNDAGQWRPDR